MEERWSGCQRGNSRAHPMVLDWSLFYASLPIPLQTLSPLPPKDSKFNCFFSSSLLRFQPEMPLFLPQNTAHSLFHTCPLSSSFFTPQLGQALKSIITPFPLLNSPKEPSQLESPPVDPESVVYLRGAGQMGGALQRPGRDGSPEQVQEALLPRAMETQGNDARCLPQNYVTPGASQ